MTQRPSTPASPPPHQPCSVCHSPSLTFATNALGSLSNECLQCAIDSVRALLQATQEAAQLTMSAPRVKLRVVA